MLKCSFYAEVKVKRERDNLDYLYVKDCESYNCCEIKCVCTKNKVHKECYCGGLINHCAYKKGVINSEKICKNSKK